MDYNNENLQDLREAFQTAFRKIETGFDVKVGFAGSFNFIPPTKGFDFKLEGSFLVPYQNLSIPGTLLYGMKRHGINLVKNADGFTLVDYTLRNVKMPFQFVTADGTPKIGSVEFVQQRFRDFSRAFV